MNSLIDRRNTYYQFYNFNKIYFFYNELLKPLLEIELYDKIGISNKSISNPHINLIDINILNF